MATYTAPLAGYRDDTVHGGESSGYPMSNTIGSTAETGTKYAGVKLTTGNNAETKVFMTFDLSEIPENATITSVTANVRVYGSTTGQQRTQARTAQLYKGTTAQGSSVLYDMKGSAVIASIADGGAWTREDLDNLALLVYAQRNTSNSTTTTYLYWLGADVTVEYELVQTHNITVQCGEGVTSSQSGTNPINSGESCIIDLHGTIASITDNGANVLNQLVVHTATEGDSGTLSNNLGTYTLISGTFNSSGANYFSGRSGYGYDATTSTSNYYSSSSSTKAVFQYDVSFSNIPANATITRVYLKATGKCESTSNTNEYMCVQLKSGNTALTTQYNWKNSGSTSVSTQTLECTTLPTIDQLSNLVIECTLGYYGGNIAGATVYVEYTVPGVAETYYTYTINNVTTDHIVIIAADAYTNLYIQVDANTVKRVKKVYIKSGNSWNDFTDLTTYFIKGKHFQRG